MQLQNPWGLVGAEKAQRFPRGLPKDLRQVLGEVGPEKGFWVTYDRFLDSIRVLDFGAAGLHRPMVDIEDLWRPPALHGVL